MALHKNIALFLEPNSHFLDHLGVFCSIFDIPTLFSDPALEKKAHRFFPHLKTTLISPSQLQITSLSSLAKNYYIPLYRYSKDFLKLTQTLLEKRPRFIYVPHGFSHKIRPSDIADHAHLDDFFIHGQTESRLFAKEQINPSNIHLGDYRYHFYNQNYEFYNQIIFEEIIDHLPQGRKLLYAPTWLDPRAPTPFFNVVYRLLQLLPKKQVLIIKPHPLLYRYELSSMLQLQQKIANDKNVFLLDDFPLVLPLLEKVDGLITDHSSIGYDFLRYNKPIYFLLDDKSKNSHLHNCGVNISKINLSEIFQPQDKNPKYVDAIKLYKSTFHNWDNLAEFKQKMEKEHFA